MTIAPPTIAAKWRASSFIALSEGKNLKITNPAIADVDQVEAIVMDDISKLFDNFFGPARPVGLVEHQRDRLRQVLASGLEWNSVLKGEVIMLGDFQPIFYERGSKFSPDNMLEFEADKKRKLPPGVAICTIGLGLALLHTKEQGDNPQKTVVHKPMIVTEHLYA